MPTQNKTRRRLDILSAVLAKTHGQHDYLIYAAGLSWAKFRKVEAGILTSSKRSSRALAGSANCKRKEVIRSSQRKEKKDE